MATERIDVIVSERGSRVVKRNLEDIGAGARKAESGVQLLRSALGYLGAALGVRELARLVDSFTEMDNKLKLATGSTEGAAAAFGRLLGIANKTRAPVADLVTLFQRASIAGKELGASQEQLFNFTETVGTALALQGGSAEAASGALLQLSQSLGSGIVRAEEFNSILEGAYPIALAAAKGIDAAGGSVARLRSLVVDGKITSDVFFKGILSQQKELEAQFAKSNPTIAQSFTVLKNNMTAFLGQAATGSGVVKALTTAILALANNLETIARIVGAGGALWGIVKLFNLARTAVLGFTAALAANPIGAIAVALATVTSLLVTFSDKIDLGSEGMATLADYAAVSFQTISEGVRSLAAWFADRFGFIGSLVSSVFGGVEFSIAGMVRFAAKAIDGLLKLVSGAVNKVISAVNIIGEATGIGGGLGKVDLTFATDFVENTISKADARAAQRAKDAAKPPAFDNTAAGAPAAVAEKEKKGRRQVTFAELVGDLQRENMVLKANREERESLATVLQFEDQLKRQLTVTERAQVEGLVKANEELQRQDILKDINVDLDRQTSLLGMNNAQREINNQLLQVEDQIGRALTETERTGIQAKIEKNRELQVEADLLDELRGPLEAYEMRLTAITSLLAKGAITQDQFNQKQRELKLDLMQTDQTLQGGFARGWLQVQENLSKVGDTASNFVVNSFESASDALAEFVATGKLRVKDLVKSILADFARMQLQSFLNGVFNSAGGGGGGSGIGGIVAGAAKSLFGFATGGSFTVGGAGGIDSVPVAFKASPGERVSITKPGQGNGNGDAHVTMNIYTNDADSFRRSETQIVNRLSGAITRAQKRR